MKRFLAMAAAASALAFAAPAAAQHLSGWQPIDQRQAQIEHRIEVGLRSGALTRYEAHRLRAEADALARLEARYRINGLSAWERADLDRRFDALAARVRYERRDDDRNGRWLSIDARQRNLDARIDAGVRDGSLTRSEAYRLRADFAALARLESHYRRDGLSRAERADLDRRFDRLSAEIRAERNDWQDRGRG